MVLLRLPMDRYDMKRTARSPDFPAVGVAKAGVGKWAFAGSRRQDDLHGRGRPDRIGITGPVLARAGHCAAHRAAHCVGRSTSAASWVMAWPQPSWKPISACFRLSAALL